MEEVVNASGDEGTVEESSDVEEALDDVSSENNEHDEETEEGSDHGDEDDSSEEDRTKKTPTAKENADNKKALKKAIELSDGELDRLVKYKVDGKEEKITIKEALKRAQKGEAADKRFRETAEDKAKIRQLLHLSKTNPRAYLRNLGIDTAQFAIEELDEYLKLQEMDPKDRRIMEFEKREAERIAKEKEEEEAAREYERQQKASAAAKEIDNQLLAAFQKSGLPKKKIYMQQMTARAYGALARDEELNFDDIADKVKVSVREDISELLKSMDADAIQEMIGEENVKKLIDAKIRKVTGKAPSNESKRPGKSPVPKSTNKPLNEREWDKYLESLREKTA